jgi:4-hydroxybenzoate polyprenyltransferase
METLKTFTPWFRLARLPNLLTVPGDPIAGFLLAAASAPRPLDAKPLFAAAGAALCLYLFGLILNDIVDIETDRQERPERPLPAGDITVPQARLAAIAMALSGLNLALVAGRPALYAAATLAALIFLYNAALKRIPVAGVVTMGLCRGVSLLLGAVAAGLPESPAEAAPAVAAAAGITAYVTAFSTLAKREMEADKPQGPVRWFPFAALLLTLPAVWIIAATLHRQPSQPSILPTVYVFLMVMTLMRAWLLGGLMYRLQPVPATIGGHIRNLLMAQACFCAATGQTGLLPALLFVLLSFVFPRLSARFYSS